MRKNTILYGLVLMMLIAVPKFSSAVTAATVTSPYVYSFNSDGILDEAGSMSESSSRYWWLNSGGQMYFKDGVGQTVQGDLPTDSYWRKLYARNNPVDTDNGYHPQNIFRLLTRSTWQNAREQVYFKIMADQLSQSPNRNSSNGVLLFNRYYDGKNTYYAGLRVDGAAVIKKKIKGKYYTLAYKKVLSGSYDRVSSPNLIPKNTWIGLRTETVNGAGGSVTIKLFADMQGDGKWAEILSVVDNGKSYGGAALTNYSYGGIRTDFMDVQFDHFRIDSL